MKPEKDLYILLSNMRPYLNNGIYVFSTVDSISDINMADIIMFFKEEEGLTVITRKEVALRLGLVYSFEAAWITLHVHSALDAIGLTSAFAQALTSAKISCNVIAGNFHDHIFVPYGSADDAMNVLQKLSNKYKEEL